MPHYHIIVNGERLVLKSFPRRSGEHLVLDEVGAGEQCEDCGCNVTSSLEYSAAQECFVCDCGAQYRIRDGGYIAEDPEPARAKHAPSMY